MKKLLRIAVALSAVALSFACTKDNGPANTGLEVTPNNISGIWSLTEFCGEPLVEGVYCYMDIQRRDKKYVSYQNITGTPNVAVKDTGRYDLYEGDVIKGVRDYNFSEYWEHAFTISGLTDDRMVWTATDDPDLVLVFVKCDSIPDGVTKSQVSVE